MGKLKLTEEQRVPLHKRTSQGGRVAKTSTMNKKLKKDFKRYKGQGK
jgi:hypothetical protein